MQSPRRLLALAGVALVLGVGLAVGAYARHEVLTSVGAVLGLKYGVPTESVPSPSVSEINGASVPPNTTAAATTSRMLLNSRNASRETSSNPASEPSIMGSLALTPSFILRFLTLIGNTAEKIPPGSSLRKQLLNVLVR